MAGIEDTAMPKLSIKTETLRQALRVAAVAQGELPPAERKVSVKGTKDKDGAWFTLRIAYPGDLHLELCGAAEGEMDPPLCVSTDALYDVVRVCGGAEREHPITLARAGDKGPATVTATGQSEPLKAAPGEVATWLPADAERAAEADYQPAQLASDLAFVRAAVSSKGPSEYQGVAFAGRHLVATDGKALHLCADVAPLQGEKARPALLPLRAARVLDVLLALPGVEVAGGSYQTETRALVFHVSGERLGAALGARVAEGEFPNYRAVLPKGKPLATATVKAEPLRVALKRAATERKGVRLTLGKMLRLEALDLTKESAASEELAVLECDRKGDEKAAIVQCFDAGLLLRATGADDAVVLAFCHPDADGAFTAPLVLRNKRRMALAMPVQWEAEGKEKPATNDNAGRKKLPPTPEAPRAA
jgi:hypothetical protein